MRQYALPAKNKYVTSAKKTLIISYFPKIKKSNTLREYPADMNPLLIEILNKES